MTCPFCGADDHPTETGVVPGLGEVACVRCTTWEAATDEERHEIAGRVGERVNSDIGRARAKRSARKEAT